MVKRLTIESVTNKDGKLKIPDIEVGLAETHVRVQLVIDPESAESLSDWNLFVDRTEGKIDDETFRRHDQGVFRPLPDFDLDDKIQ